MPNVFTIELSPGDYDRLHPDLQNVEMDLVAAAEEHCDGQRYQPAGPIDIIFEEHDDLETGVFRIRPSKASRPRATGHTGAERALRPHQPPDAGRDAPAAPAGPGVVRSGAARCRGGRRAAGAGRPGSAPGRATSSTRPHGIRHRPRPPGPSGSTRPTGPGSTSTASATR